MREQRRRSRACLAASLILAASAGMAAPSTNSTDPWARVQATLRDRYPAVQAVIVRRGGCRTFAFYRHDVTPDTRLPLHSMTKSVLSMLLGLAIDHGDLGFDETLGELLPEAGAPGVDPRVKRISVRQLMTMTAGLDAEAKPPAGMVLAQMWRWSLARSFLSAPGTRFRYDNYGANLLSVLLTRRTGHSAETSAREKLFGPMEIRNETWLDDGDGHSVGAYGLWLTAEDMAKIGELALHHGVWNGRRLLPDAFMTAATRKHGEGGPPFYAAYGYLWWVKPTKTGLPAFFAAGSDGQAIYAVPARDLVVVLASDKTPPGGAVRLIDDVILPAAAASTGETCSSLSAPAGPSRAAVPQGR